MKPPPKPPSPSKSPPGATVKQAAAAPTGMQWPDDDKPEALRIMISAVQGWGKTTTAAYMDNPVFIMIGGETGYKTLYSMRRVPKVPFFHTQTFAETLAAIDVLIADPGDRKTLVIDSISGLEQQCYTHVCQRDFSGDWGERGFAAYSKGEKMSVNDWVAMQRKLDVLRETHGITIVYLSHIKIDKFANPTGPDFDRYTTNLNQKYIGGIADDWCDAVLFGTYYTVVKEGRGQKAKGIGGNIRVVYTSRRDAWNAKNRCGMPERIDIPDDHTQIWETIKQTIKKEGD